MKSIYVRRGVMDYVTQDVLAGFGMIFATIIFILFFGSARPTKSVVTAPLILSTDDATFVSKMYGGDWSKIVQGDIIAIPYDGFINHLVVIEPKRDTVLVFDCRVQAGMTCSYENLIEQDASLIKADAYNEKRAVIMAALIRQLAGLDN